MLLHMAAESTGDEMPRVLLESGLEPHAQNNDLWTPSPRLVRNHSASKVRVLFDTERTPVHGRMSAGQAFTWLSIVGTIGLLGSCWKIEIPMSVGGDGELGQEVAIGSAGIRRICWGGDEIGVPSTQYSFSFQGC